MDSASLITYSDMNCARLSLQRTIYPTTIFSNLGIMGGTVTARNSFSEDDSLDRIFGTGVLELESGAIGEAAGLNCNHLESG